MRIRITHIDFNNNRIGLELHPDACHGMLEQLGTFLVDCRACRFTNIYISCRPGMTNLQMLILEELC